MLDPRVLVVLALFAGLYYVGEKAVAGVKKVDRAVVHGLKVAGRAVEHKLGMCDGNDCLFEKDSR